MREKASALEGAREDGRGEGRRGVLDGIRVVDLGRHRAGAVTALLLAELGASVIKVRVAHDRGPGLDAVQAALWDRSKSVLDIDLDDPAGRARLQALVDGADVVVQDRTPAEMARLGTDAATLGGARPDLIFATITGWPAGHRHENRPVDDMLVLAEAGLLDEQAMTARDGPAFVAFPLGSAHAAFLSATGIVARLLYRQRGGSGGSIGRGGRVATSLLQGALLPMMMYWQRAARPTPMVAKGMPKDTPQPLYRCGDGLWIHVMGDPGKTPAVAALAAQLDADQKREANDAFYHGRSIAYPNLGVFAYVFQHHPREFWLRELWQAGVAVQPVSETATLFHDEQARASGYIAEVATQAFGVTRQANVPIHLAPPVRVRDAATLSDWPARPSGASRETGGESFGASGAAGSAGSSAAKEETESTGTGPLTGTKVLDFGSYLAGPLATMLLADLGADVVKVEAIGGEPLRPIEWAFNGCQRGKRGLALDLTHEAAKDVVARLVARTDIVHHNQRMPTAVKLGIDYASLRKINPLLVHTHVSAYGPRGPRKDWPGYDQLFQAASGWELASAGEGNDPNWLRFGMMDHLAALASLLGTVGALYERDRHGDGQAVHASLLGASLFTLATALDANDALLPGPRLDDRQMGFSPMQRVYACSDGWIAVSDADVAAEFTAEPTATHVAADGRSDV
ncbi:MAG: CoA transferase, partial [Janthinobacterium lividum]